MGLKKSWRPVNWRQIRVLGDTALQIFGTKKKELAPVLLESFNWTLEKAIEAPSWKDAVMSVIPKEWKIGNTVSHIALCQSWKETINYSHPWYQKTRTLPAWPDTWRLKTRLVLWNDNKHRRPQDAPFIL